MCDPLQTEVGAVLQIKRTLRSCNDCHGEWNMGELQAAADYVAWASQPRVAGKIIGPPRSTLNSHSGADVAQHLAGNQHGSNLLSGGLRVLVAGAGLHARANCGTEHAIR